MLMDLFHSTLPPQFKSHQYGSTRIHFHSFMLDVLQRQHEVKKRYESVGAGKKDALPEVARSLAAEGRVLCFDEFQVGLPSAYLEASLKAGDRHCHCDDFTWSSGASYGFWSGLHHDIQVSRDNGTRFEY